ncbi:Oxysterol-binding protein-domain-containing protein [Peziza echinospora]|nr:Oxysterol-binding protein-domain-containing protein [Peziza echinospora]
MAAMEQLEVHSKSYLIRWVNCAPNHTISWSIKPHKKSLNFGIFKHPGSEGGAAAGISSIGGGQSGNNGALQAKPDGSQQRPVSSRGRATSSSENKYEGDCIDRLHAVGLLDVYWHGKCEPEKVTTGSYQVKGQGGMFALVFDNTFSKQLSKIVTVILLTYPSNNPPPASHHLNHSDAGSLATPASPPSQKVSSPRIGVSNASMESVTLDAASVKSSATTGFYTGQLKKRKRKRHQGFARRYFSLDFASSTLSYYMNRESTMLRGAIPLSLAAISANAKDREICIDSGAEVWHLRALSQPDWEGWKNALEKAAAQAQKKHSHSGPGHPRRSDTDKTLHTDYAEDRSWAVVETLVGKIGVIRDQVKALSTPAPIISVKTDGISHGSEAGTSENSPLPSPFPSSPVTPSGADRRPFWKRKVSGTSQPSGANSPSLHPGHASGRPTGALAALAVIPPMLPVAPTSAPMGAKSGPVDQDVSPQLNALLADLNSVYNEFNNLLSENKQRRWLNRKSEMVSTPIATSRASFETTASEEFFDATDDMPGGRVGVLNDDSDNEGGSGKAAAPSTIGDNEATDEDSGSSSDDDSIHHGGTPPPATNQGKGKRSAPVAQGPRDLSPLPLQPIPRRKTVLASTVTPPSLIGFLRKNVGKDLSTIAMPVSANEPTSLVQRLAENMEYSELLDAAAKAPRENGERILHIAAFAVSGFSYARMKERAIRKPFNPMLGETYELVREDKGFRFLAEKVSHRPVIMACHADAEDWTFTQSPMPTQKFWGKSAELNTTGRVRIHFQKLQEQYSYTIATSFLRNIIAGEKYVEPVGNMTVHCETTGEKALVTFKAKGGMFSGRSEDVEIQALDPQGQPYEYTLIGKWTSDLSLYTDNSSTLIRRIWTVGNLVEQAAVRYGFTEFAAQLNELTKTENQSVLPQTDSRLRPDQRMLEEGRIDEAEEMKRVLEEKQRERRKEDETSGAAWRPRWFVKVREYADEEVWRIKTVEDDGAESGGGYWEQRKEGKWTDVPVIF